jgi:uncharacterized membrane protein YeaQ/YmgE (transglycosylase-associated protein family)
LKTIGFVSFEGKREYAVANDQTGPGIAPPLLHAARFGNSAQQRNGGTPMLHLLWTAIIGIVVGAIAKLIMPGKEPGGIFITTIIGIAGSFLGTYLGRLIGHYQDGQTAGFLMSLVGALILLGIYNLIRRSTQSV